MFGLCLSLVFIYLGANNDDLTFLIAAGLFAIAGSIANGFALLKDTKGNNNE